MDPRSVAMDGRRSRHNPNNSLSGAPRYRQQHPDSISSRSTTGNNASMGMRVHNHSSDSLPTAAYSSPYASDVRQGRAARPLFSQNSMGSTGGGSSTSPYLMSSHTPTHSVSPAAMMSPHSMSGYGSMSSSGSSGHLVPQQSIPGWMLPVRGVTADINNPLKLSSMARTTVLANHPIPRSRRPTRNEVDMFYFEINVPVTPAWIGFVAGKCPEGKLPGEFEDSIGMGSDGFIRINGQVASTVETSILDGDVMGCGIETTGLQRVHFTANGRKLLFSTTFAPESQIRAAVGMIKGSTIMGNFGYDRKFSFEWSGSERAENLGWQHSDVMNQKLPADPHWKGGMHSDSPARKPPPPSAHPSDMHAYPPSQHGGDFTRSSAEASVLFGSRPRRQNMLDAPEDDLDLLLPRGSKPLPSSSHPVARSPMSMPAERPAWRGESSEASWIADSNESNWRAESNDGVYGKKISKSSLMDEVDPHYPPPITHRRDMVDIPPQAPIHTMRLPPQNDPMLRAGWDREGSFGNDTLQTQPPRNSISSPMRPLSHIERVDDYQRASTQGHMPVGSDNLGLLSTEIQIMEENARVLAAVSRGDNLALIQECLDTCRLDKNRVQEVIEHTKDDFDFDFERVITLFGLIDEAITSGEDALSNMDAPSNSGGGERIAIPLLVREKDIFSLICMLRAQDEKRLESALALMKFAKDPEPVSEIWNTRDEIRTSGGMHSLLALYRTSGTTRELKVVASLAVAYVIPSFMDSSPLQSPALGLKIMECLHFLITSDPVSPMRRHIPRKEMLEASTVGVVSFWVNGLQPMLASEASRNDFSSDRVKTITRSFSRGRIRGRSGGVFDQQQQRIEVQELTEMAVSLIVHMANVDYDERLHSLRSTLVEQMCTVDIARPIAVRKGLIKTLVEWMTSKQRDKVSPAAHALRSLTSIEDKYMAGWIHSQMLNEGALDQIAKLIVSDSFGHDVRLAFTQILSSLCVAPHTRAAVVEADCISSLSALLFEHSDPASQQVALFAGSALLQLAAGAMARASVFDGDMVVTDFVSPDKRDTLVDDIVNRGAAVGSFVSIALEHTGELRSMAIEALRVLSEDSNPNRQTRLQLCEGGAARAIGLALRDDVRHLDRISNPETFYGDDDGKNSDDGSSQEIMKELHEALCALANILDPIQEAQPPPHQYQSSQCHFPASSGEHLTKGCKEAAESGGIESLLRIARIPFDSDASCSIGTVDQSDLLVEASRSLASLSPLLLSAESAAEGNAKWSVDVLEALIAILQQASSDEEPSDVVSLGQELEINALRGLVALATCEPLKIVIVEKSLPFLLRAKNKGERNNVSNTASQVFLSLGFAEDEIAIQVAGNDPKLLVDWFCLQRALIIQEMARAEIREVLRKTWTQVLETAKLQGTEMTRLFRSLSNHSASSGNSGNGEGNDELFENIAHDEETAELRASITQMYRDIYGEATRSAPAGSTEGPAAQTSSGEASILSRQIYPLNDSNVEKDWILSHQRFFASDPKEIDFNGGSYLGAGRVDSLLNCCFPSRLLRRHVLPTDDLNPEASFNFRALMMPQRRYFSFRREGQLVSRLCDKQAATLDSDDVHWTLGFTNSTFAGEFAETLVQGLYLCPMIRGLSFARTAQSNQDLDHEDEGDDGCGGVLANLTGSLPPWISYVTFDNSLSDRDLRTMVAIIETMGTLAAGGMFSGDVSLASVPEESSAGQKQGNFSFFGVRNSPHILSDSWEAFFKLLGRTGPTRHRPTSSPLSSLKILDLSGNRLGDEACAHVLKLVHDKNSGCMLEQLDLSGNRIEKGVNVVKVLRLYVEHHRYNQSAGVHIRRKTWKSSLRVLRLGENNLEQGRASMEIIALLKHNALGLQSLDLSHNGLEGSDDEFTDVLASSLLKNTKLRHLNLSGNRLSAQVIERVLDRLNEPDTGSSLAFLLFENNDPPLEESHKEALAKFHTRSRKSALERLLIEREEAPAPENEFDDSSFGEHSSSALFKQAHDDDDASASGLARAGTTPKGDNMITVLFSAPLVYRDNNQKLTPFAKLDFDMERELLWHCLKEASRDIELSFDCATHDRLLATMTKRCSCLHYSGHGHQQYLPFEDGEGYTHWLKVELIKELIEREGGAPFKFVFVSACHSGLAGETFASAGVPHVVCCRQDSELKDRAALAFTRQFYLSLVVGHTVKESFEQGKKAVRATPNLRDPDQEMEKFVLLPRDGNHDVPVFDARVVREWPQRPTPSQQLFSAKSRRRSLMRQRSLHYPTGARSSELSVRNMMQEDPAPTPPHFFLGREVDMYNVLTNILKLRLVSVLGDRGMGRFSLVCALCHYINERASIYKTNGIETIYFIKAKQSQSKQELCRSIILQLLEKLVEGGKANPPSPGADTEALINHVCQGLKGEKALIVFDHTELLDRAESQEFPIFLRSILTVSKSVRVLLTGRRKLSIPAVGGHAEKSITLGPLNLQNTVRLFANLCPHLHTPAERSELFKRLVIDGEQADMIPGDEGMTERTKSLFSMLGDGIPSRIEKAADSVTLERLQELGN